MAEQPPCKRQVASSILAVSSERVARVLEAGRSVIRSVGYPSGQREQTVNLSAPAFEGSNPSPTTVASVAGVAQLVERKPSKLDVAGSSPVSRSNMRVFTPNEVLLA